MCAIACSTKCHACHHSVTAPASALSSTAQLASPLRRALLQVPRRIDQLRQSLDGVHLHVCCGHARWLCTKKTTIYSLAQLPSAAHESIHERTSSLGLRSAWRCHSRMTRRLQRRMELLLGCDSRPHHCACLARLFDASLRVLAPCIRCILQARNHEAAQTCAHLWATMQAYFASQAARTSDTALRPAMCATCDAQLALAQSCAAEGPSAQLRKCKHLYRRPRVGRPRPRGEASGVASAPNRSACCASASALARAQRSSAHLPCSAHSARMTSAKLSPSCSWALPSLGDVAGAVAAGAVSAQSKASKTLRQSATRCARGCRCEELA